MKRIHLLIALLLFSFTSVTMGQTDLLRHKIEQIIMQQKADVGVAIYGFDSHDTLSFNGNRHFPMQSVFKFHIALAVLNQVDKGTLSLNQEIYISESDLLLNTWSPLREEYPNGDIRLPLSKILEYTVSKSDNNGCDILLRLIGGTQAVQKYINSIGIDNFSIQASEEEMRKGWNVQFTNWTTPLSAIHVLKKFYNREILSASSYEFLWNIMKETTTGGNRIRGRLPKEAIVAHKTGTSGANEQGISAAVNDIGIVVLPDGRKFAICVFVSNSKESTEGDEKVIAAIAKEVWDYFVSSGISGEPNLYKMH